MANFPALQPSGRTFTDGEYPAAAFAGVARGESRVRLSSGSLNQRLRLSFIGLTQSQAKDVVDHYNGQLGAFRTFSLPAIVWSGVTAGDYEGAATQWRYVAPPQVEDMPCRPDGSHIYSVTLELEGTRGVLVTGPTILLTVAATWSPGQQPKVTNTDLLVTVMLAHGVPLPPPVFEVPVSFEHDRPAIIWPTVTATFDVAFAGMWIVGASYEHGSPVVTESSSLLLHMDGGNGSTTFTDSSDNAFSVTRAGNAQISTAESKFGGASGLFDGTGDYLDVAGNVAFQFPAEFTIDCWIRPANTSSTMTIIEINLFNTGGILLRPAGTSCAYVNGTDMGAFNSFITANVWQHIALTRDASNVCRLFVDGTQRLSSTISGTINSTNTALRIGSSRHVSGQDWNGYMDEFRIVKGRAVWTANFTPPSAPY